jgi:hypothetical protein
MRRWILTTYGAVFINAGTSAWLDKRGQWVDGVYFRSLLGQKVKTSLLIVILCIEAPRIDCM